MNRREVMESLGALTAAMTSLGSSTAAAAVPALTLDSLETGADDFYRAPVLIGGAGQVLLVDGAMTLSSGRELVAKIKATGKTLYTIFVTCADPDYYFGLGPLRDAFPDVKVLANAKTVQTIHDTAAHKLDVWRAKLGSNGPQSLSEVVIPQVWKASNLSLEGRQIAILTDKQPNRWHLWVPSLKAILGGVQVVSGTHVWMADTPTQQERDSWLASLDDMLAMQPDAVFPGHRAPGGPMGRDALKFTRDYIVAFDAELRKSPHSVSLIAAMKKRYPDLALDSALELGAKVCTGEMKWP